MADKMEFETEGPAAASIGDADKQKLREALAEELKTQIDSIVNPDKTGDEVAIHGRGSVTL